ncbi:TonB-dependent receptor [Aquirufa sp.]|jgi:iron complex outermembrane receptor protein|uniref:TonB-dependent receptor n=1 Tax=Aquirufa sp. TaxID=2676249 RepID=UPI0037BEAA93
MKKLMTLVFLFFTHVVFGQKVEGIVFDQDTKAPLWGASVSVKGSQKGNVTDSKGRFQLAFTSSSATILVSFVGYEPAEVPVEKSKQIGLKKSNFLQDEVVVRATRADENSAMAYSNVSATELGKSNLGQDMPMLLNFTPSVVTTSDAGAGIGYTGIRIRGSDATRVNVTVNGIPINDSESQGTFWVNMPDFASSVNSVQIQRGVGTSTNGAGAFGGSVNMQTNTFEPNAYGEANASGGSFGTLKTTLKFGSGLLGGKFTLDGRLSRIVSDGFINRASSNLLSAYFSAGYFGAKSFARFNYFTGNEKTYQSWYGTPESRVNGSVDEMKAFIDRNYLSESDANNLLNSGRRYNYYTYDNQTDNYAQDHFQLITNHRLAEAWNLDLNAHYTYGRGYFEEFRPNADLQSYGLGAKPIVDVVRRKWLDNDFYGSTFALNYAGSQKFKFTFGGAWNRYIGRHYGLLVAPVAFAGHEWYRSRSQKTDLNLYAKANWDLATAWNAYFDVQFRTVGYRMLGTADKFLTLDSDNSYSFFNPKFGLTHQVSEKSKVYGSVSAGSKEPSRQDFVDNAAAAPRPEYLQDYEFGYERSGLRYGLQLNGYFMNYQDQLVLTGAVNSTGDAIRQNVDASYRLGVEASLNYQISKRLSWNGNVTLSQNRIRQFKEVVIDYDTYDQAIIHHTNTDIAFSPSVIYGSTLTYTAGAFEGSILRKYVGKQYLDNTSDDARSLAAYNTHDIRLKYTLKKGPVFTLLLNNVLNEMYSSNGYTYSYRYGGATTTENFYYPQAGFNFLLGASIRF